MLNSKEREVFHTGMDLMQETKQSIIDLRDLIAKGKEIIECNNQDNEDIQIFYRQEIANAQKVVSDKKHKALSFITANKQEYPKSIAIFEDEYNSLPS